MIKEKIHTSLKEVTVEADRIFDGVEKKSVRRIRGNE